MYPIFDTFDKCDEKFEADLTLFENGIKQGSLTWWPYHTFEYWYWIMLLTYDLAIFLQSF